MSGFPDDYDAHETTGTFGFYFGLRPRSIVTIPLFLLMAINLVYHGVMFFLIEVDLLIGNFVVWLLLGFAIAGTLGWLPILASYAPFVWLPPLWHSRKIWGIAKIMIFIVGFALTLIFSGMLSALALWVLDFVVDLKTTLWWAEFWGVVQPAG